MHFLQHFRPSTMDLKSAMTEFVGSVVQVYLISLQIIWKMFFFFLQRNRGEKKIYNDKLLFTSLIFTYLHKYSIF